MGLARAVSGERRWRASLAGALFIPAAAAVLAGCGVTFGSGGQSSEFFTRLQVTGDARTGGQLTLDLKYSQVYPVSLTVVCDLLDPNKPTPTGTPAATREPGLAKPPKPTPTPVQIPKPETTPVTRVQVILNETVGPNSGVPTVTQEKAPFDKVTPVAASLTRTFPAPEKPGHYIVRCLTPADNDNQIRKAITIKSG